MSFIIQPSAASNVFSATASGAITANKPCILNSNGTVSEIVLDSGTVGSEQTFLPSSFQIVGGQMLDLGSNNFAVLAVEIATSYIGIVIVTLSGTNLTTVSFGSFQALSTSYFWQGASPTGLYGAQMIYDAANNKIIFATQTGAWRGGPFGFTRYPSLGVIVCTISGTTITPGSMYTFTINDITGRQSGGTGYATIVWDSTQNRLIYIYQNSDDLSGRYTQYQMMSISGTVVSLVTGQTDLSPTVIAVSSDYSNEAIVYEANINRILWWTWRAGTYTLRMFSNNGSTITEVTNSATTTFAPNTAKLIPGSSGLITSGTNSSGYPTGWPFSVTASTITPGTQTVLNSAIAANGTFAAINRVSPNSGVIFYSIGSTMYAKAISSLSTSLVTITVPSGTNNVSFGAIDTQNTYGFSNSASRALKISRYFSGSYGLKAVAGNAIGSNLYSSTQFIGFSSAAASNGENVNIATMGAQISGQSSLTLPNLYYVQTDGTLSTTAGTPSVLAGYAVSSNTIIVKGTGS